MNAFDEKERRRCGIFRPVARQMSPLRGFCFKGGVDLQLYRSHCGSHPWCASAYCANSLLDIVLTPTVLPKTEMRLDENQTDVLNLKINWIES